MFIGECPTRQVNGVIRFGIETGKGLAGGPHDEEVCQGPWAKHSSCPDVCHRVVALSQSATASPRTGCTLTFLLSSTGCCQADSQPGHPELMKRGLGLGDTYPLSMSRILLTPISQGAPDVSAPHPLPARA